MGSKRRVAYYYDEDVGAFSYGWAHPMKPFRIRLAHSLITSYNMLPKMDVIRPTRATPFSMTRFHTDEYVDFLHRVTPETAMDMTGHGARFLAGDDNPAFEGVFEFSSISAGGSVAAAERLNAGTADIAINWSGGLHHAKKGEGSGFCYINDIVLGILELLRFHTRVLYIDIDFHHGDGVEEAFYSTDRVLTCSFHKQKDSFPGTGKLGDRGIGKGKGYAVNVPLLQGITDEGFQSVFEPVIQGILDWFRPDAVVLQCGADSLSEDKLGCFNLSMYGHSSCVKFLRSKNVPLILLGGGGYTVRNVACAWTYETACALGIEKDLDLNVPYNDYLEWYGPRYKLEIRPSNITNDNNTRGYLDKMRQDVLTNLRDLPFAPSVAQYAVPRRNLSEEIGLTEPEGAGDADGDDDRELDAEIRRRVLDIMQRSHRHHPPGFNPNGDDDDDEMEPDVENSSTTSDESFLFTANHRSRNLYSTNLPFSSTRVNGANAHANGHHESDEEIHISEEDEDEDDGEDGHLASSSNRRQPNGNGRQKSQSQAQSHGHGTRAAMAALTHLSSSHGNGTANGNGMDGADAPRRTFFANGFFPPNARLVRPQLWDGNPVVEVPYQGRGILV